MRHGTYTRSVVDESGTEHEIRIQRLRCENCPGKRTHSLLYDFLIPYCKYTVKSMEQPVVAYVLEPTTYLGALNEVVSETATLFKAVKMMLLHLPEFWMHLMQSLIAAGYSAEMLASDAYSPNSTKCRSEEKQKRLDWSAQLLRLVPNIFAEASRRGYPLFANGRGCKLLRTHSRECAPF